MTARSEELQTMTTSSLGDLIRKQLADEIELTARELRIGRQLVTINRQLVPKGKGNTIEFFKRGTVTAAAVSEGGTISTAEPSYSKVLTVTASKIGAGSKITHEAITDVREDVIAACKEEIAEAIANKEDDDILQSAYGATEQEDKFNGDGSTVTFDLTKYPAVKLISATVDDVAVEATIDPRESTASKVSQVTFASAPGVGTENVVVTYNYASINYVDATAAGEVAIADVLGARLKIVNSEKNVPDILVISEALVHELLKLDQFIDSSKYGAREALLNGEIGKLFGMKLLISSQVNTDVPILLRKEKAVVLAEKEGIRVETDEKPATDSLEIYVTERYGLGLLRSGAAACIVA